MNSKISFKHNYTIAVHDDDYLIITVDTEEMGTMKFEGINGNLVEASSWYDEDDTIEMTLAKCLESSVEFLTDWGVDADTAKAITADLKPWFEKFAISEEKAIANRVAELERWIAGRRESIAQLARAIDGYHKTIANCESQIDRCVSEIISINKDIEMIEKTIAGLKAERK